MGNNLAIMNENGVYISTMVIDGVNAPEITQILPFVRQKVALIGTIDTEEYVYIVDIPTKTVIGKFENEYASIYTGKYTVVGTEAIYYSGSNVASCIIVKYDALGNILWSRIVPNRSSEAFGDGMFAKVIGITVGKTNNVCVKTVYLDNYNAAGPDIDIRMASDQYSTDGERSDLGVLNIANLSSGTEVELRSGYIDGDIVVNLSDGLYYAIAINANLTSIINNGHGINSNVFVESIERIMLNVDIDNRPMLELKGSTTNLISKVYVGEVAGSTSGNFGVIIGATNNRTQYVNDWDTEDTPVFRRKKHE